MNKAIRLDNDLNRIARFAREGYAAFELTRAAQERLDREDGLAETFKMNLWNRIYRDA